MEQIKSLEINPHTYGQLIYDITGKIIQQRTRQFLQQVLVKKQLNIG